MRRRPAALAVLALTTALLAACGQDDAGQDPSPAESTEASATPAGEELPTVEGGFGQDPTITFPGTGAPAELEVEILEEGDGAEVGADDFVVANYVGQVWDGEVFDSSFERGAPAGFSLNGVIPGWKQGLTGTQEGDRVLLSIPAELGYGDNPPGEPIAAGDTLVFVVDLLGAYAPDAVGQADAVPVEPAPELPVTVTGGPGEVPTISVTEGATAPAEPVSTVVATGSGEAVPDAQGSTVVLQFAETMWDNSEQSSTWTASGPQAVTIGSGGVFDQLVGVPAGSRVVFQLPAQEATDTTEASPGLAAVVDILGVHAADAG